MRLRALRLIGFALPLLALVGCASGTTAGRYAMATDPASRYGFRHVRDRESGLWVHRECEAPDGDRLHSQRFAPETVASGHLVPTAFELQDGHRVWRFRDLPDDDDLTGRTALGIQVEWPKPGGPSDWEPMELFAYPPMATMVPDGWSTWTSAASQRAGAFGWWEEVHGSPPEPAGPLQVPFELRCRLLLKDHLYVD